MNNHTTTEAQTDILRDDLAKKKRALETVMEMNECYNAVKERLEAAVPPGSLPSGEDVVKEMEQRLEDAKVALQTALNDPMTPEAQRDILRDDLSKKKRALETVLEMNEGYDAVQERLEAAVPHGSPPSGEDV
eukprot:532392-Prymnesium_polylepis.1